MNRRSNYILFIFTALFIGGFNNSCTIKSGASKASTAIAIDSLIPTYSHSFRVDYYKGYKLVKVFSEKDGKTTSSYLLSENAGAKGVFENAIHINYPAKRVACMSTTHVGALKLLDARNLIVATTNKDLICDSEVIAMIKNERIKDASKDYQPDYEVIAQAKPDLLFSDGENVSSSQMFAKMKALGVNVVCSRDYFEQEPLARAEWIKFFAAFIGKERLADSIFKTVEADYLTQKAELTKLSDKPTIFCNLPYSGVWYMPCGENYVAKLITDAGGNFLWNSDKPMNGLNLTLNFEQVYERASNADIWINTSTYTELKQIATIDTKFKLFKAFKTGRVYNGVKRLSAGGGMDIWETGSYTPNIVLRDLALIFHSHDNLEKQLYYYKQLK